MCQASTPKFFCFQSEFVSSRDNRIRFVSGFTGQFGKIVIQEKTAALWVNRRYCSQAKKQIDNELWELKTNEEDSIAEWLISTLPPSSRIGVDPYLIKASYFHYLSKRLSAEGLILERVKTNLVDIVWKHRPELDLQKLEIVNDQISGSSKKNIQHFYA